MKQFSLEKKGRKQFRATRRITPQYEAAIKIRGSVRWQKTRRVFVRENPICQYCLTSPTYCPHHIEPVAEKPNLSFVWENLIAVCQECHDEIHQRMLNGEATEVKKELKEKIS